MRNLCALIVFYCLSALSVDAHDAGLSLADLRIERQNLALHLQFAPIDIEGLVAMDTDRDGQIAPLELEHARTELEALAADAAESRCDGTRLSAGETRIRTGDSGTVDFEIGFAFAACTHIDLQPTILGKLPTGHRQFLSIRDTEGHILAERVMHRNSGGFEINLADIALPESAPRAFRQFLMLGIEHIWSGYDHLLFLLGLLVAGRSALAAAKTITSFTIAHSLTLALSTMDVIQLSPGLVEPLIALSIVYVGLENILRREPQHRALLTFSFGLVHGLGFASVLRDVGVGSTTAGMAMPLLSFNFGVELGQIALAAMALPLIWKLRRQPRFAGAYLPACSTLITLAGVYWFIERVWAA